MMKKFFLMAILFFQIIIPSTDSMDRENAPEWLIRLIQLAQTKEGEELGKKLDAFLLKTGLAIGQGVGTAFGNTSEAIVKGIMRGLTDPKTTKQFTRDFANFFESFGKEALVGPSGKIIETARKELFKEADKAVDDSLDFTNRTRKKVWNGLFSNIESMSDDFENEFKRGGRSHRLIQKNAKVAANALGDAGTEITKEINKNFGKNSESYKNVQKTMDDFGDLAQRSVNYLQEMLIFDTFKYLGAGISVVMIPTLGLRYTYHYFISKLKDPRIIIETSIGSSPYEFAKSIFRFKPRRAAEKLEDMILAPKVKKRIQEIIDFEKAHRQAKEGFDNILLTGNPGTGKTMFAKAIAAELGMDYIVLTGSSFFQENAGVKALDQIFGKMTKGRKVVIFIDEIDSITASRVGKNSDSDAYRLLNQLLNYTSTPNKNFILIGATNYPELIDKAFYRRFQHVVEMPLPEYAQRLQFLTFAKNKYLMTKNKKYNEIIDTVFTDKIIKDVATKTDGLSYAELQTIIDHIKSASRLSKNGITKAIIYDAMTKVKEKESSFQKNFLKK